MFEGANKTGFLFFVDAFAQRNLLRKPGEDYLLIWSTMNNLIATFQIIIDLENANCFHKKYV